MPVTVRASPVSFLPSSFLPTSRFPHPSLNPTPKPSGSTLILARVFPFKLRYRGLTTRVRFDSGSNRASRGPNETQLSDWVSELRMGSVFTGEDAAPVTKKRVKDANFSGNGNEFGDTGRDRSDTKRMSRGGNLGGWGGRGRGGNFRRGGSNDLGTSNPRFGKRFGSEFDQENGRDDEKDSGLRSRTGPGRGGMRGGSSSGRKRGGGGRVGDRADSGRGGQAVFVVDEKKKKTVSGFMDLIGEEDSDSDLDLDGDRDEIEIGRRSSMFLREDKGESGMPSSSGADDSYLTETRFDQCAISPLTLKAIKDIGYEKMTVVQEASLPSILNGKDVMAKAKTGTGKTVAFLLPSIEVVVNSPRADHNQRRPPILVLVICPTRELACQAAAEGKTLLKYHSSVGVQVVIGGTNLAAEQKRMQANPCQILIATPGRLRDHIENTAGFATRLMGVKVLVLDEADHLLDMGFRRDIERIISAVPKQRQTLLFSATIPDEVRQISHVALKRDHEFINTVQEGAEDTHSKVRQMHLVAPLEKHFPLLYAILKDHISGDANYKVIVFCTTAMVTKLVAEVLGELNLNVREIHSRKTQSYRTRVSDEFRKSTGLILVTSDVSARGVDYPDVTLVIQLGLPSDREQYIHRLGRTGRKGKEGHGILLLAQWEEFFLSSIKDLPITKAPAPTVDPDANRKVERALSLIEMKSKESAYQAWLGYYNSNKIIGRDKTRLVELANDFSRCMGLDVPPAISRMVLGKMGLKNVPGLRTK